MSAKEEIIKIVADHPELVEDLLNFGLSLIEAAYRCQTENPKPK